MPLLTRAFAPHGPRAFAMHLERSPASASSMPAPGSAARTYVLGWSPVAARAEALVARTLAQLGRVAGSAVDPLPYPRRFDDTAIQREITREIAANGWHPSARSRFVVVTAAAPMSATVYCSYHSAFYLGGSLATPVVYGVVPTGTTEVCGPIASQIVRASQEMDADPFARM